MCQKKLEISMKKWNILCFFLCVVNISIGQSTYTLHKDQDGIKVFVKSIGNSELIQFKAEATLNTELDNVEKVFRDQSTVVEWNPQVIEFKLLNKISSNNAVYLMVYDMPFPMAKRVATIKVHMTKNKEKGILHFTIEHYPYHIPKEYQKYLVITDIKSEWIAKRVSENKVFITYEGRFDPSGDIPVYIVNEGIKRSAMNTMKRFRSFVVQS